MNNPEINAKTSFSLEAQNKRMSELMQGSNPLGKNNILIFLGEALSKLSPFHLLSQCMF